MGNCLQSNVPTRAQLSEAHLLGQDVNINKQHMHNLTDSEQHEFQYRGFNNESSMTHSNLHPVFPSNNSSPKHRPIKSNQMIYGNINENNNNHNIYNMHHIKTNNYNELQRQIDILKQCSNDEIKMLKTRIQILEKLFKQLAVQNNPSIVHDDDYKEITQMQCTKGTPTKLCPNILRLITISEIYNTKIVQSHKETQTHNEFEVWNMINSSNKYDLKLLINDYCHLLEIHCNNNNMFELRMVYLETNYIMNNAQCNNNNTTELKQCECIINIQNESFQPELLYVLNLIHCFLYHYNQKQICSDSLQRLRDCIMDKNDRLINYNQNPHKTEAKMKNINPHLDTPNLPIVPIPNIDIDVNKIDLFTLNTDNKSIKIKKTPPVPVLINKQMIASMGSTIPIDPRIKPIKPININNLNLVNNISLQERNNSIASVCSNLSRQSIPSTPRSISKHSNDSNSISSLSANNNNNNNNTKLILAPMNQAKSAIEMSVDRVRKLSGQINEEQIKELINEYDNEQKIGVENHRNDNINIINKNENGNESESESEDDGLVSPSSSASELDENDKAEIENFKLKLDADNKNNSGSDGVRRGSKHNLMRLKQGNEWDVDTMDQTVEDMKKQLFHLACSASQVTDT